MNTTHTPGPWAAIPINDNLHSSFAIDAGVHIGNLSVWPIAADEMEANARLIASAPDLLEVLQWGVNLTLDEDDFAHREFLRAARAAIAKATGGQ